MNQERCLKFCMVPVFLSSCLTLTSSGLANDEKESLREVLGRKQRTEMMNYFLQDPRQAVIPQMPVAVELYNQAVEYFEKHDYVLAQEALMESIRYHDKNPFAYELLGDVFNRRHDLPQAKEYYKKAYLLHPGEGLREKIEKISREKKVEESFSTVGDAHFTLKYQGIKERTRIPQLKQVLTEVYQTLSKEFGYTIKNPIVVLLYDQTEFKEITRLPPWISGLYDGKIRLPAYQAGLSDEDLRAIVTHEMTHAFVSEMSGGKKAPTWINEGLAVYEENKIRAVDPLVFESAVRTQTLLPLHQLMVERELVKKRDPLFVKLVYDESFRLVKFLVERYGMFSLEQLLREFGQGRDADEALRKVYGKNIDQLEEEWKTTFTG